MDYTTLWRKVPWDKPVFDFEFRTFYQLWETAFTDDHNRMILPTKFLKVQYDIIDAILSGKSIKKLQLPLNK